jgi:hypothetical protein
MGYYVETSSTHGKAREIVSKHGAILLPGTPDAFAPPPDSVLVCVVDNGWMEAAGIAYDAREFAVFTHPDDPRPRTWLALPKATAVKLNPALADVLA